MINEPESKVTKGNELGKIDQMPPEFELSFKFYINQFPATEAWYNLFHGMNNNTSTCTETTAGRFFKFLTSFNNIVME